MARAKTTGRFETREELEKAVWQDFRAGMTDAEIAARVGVTPQTVAKILRTGVAPIEPDASEDLRYPLRTQRRRVLNRGGEEIAVAKTEKVADVIVDTLNIVKPI